jgi:hypothetical protein
VVLPLFAEGVRESSESPVAHASAEIVALDNRSADTFRIGLAEDWDLFHRSYFSGALPAFAFAGGTIDLDELRETSKPIMESVVVMADL